MARGDLVAGLRVGLERGAPFQEHLNAVLGGPRHRRVRGAACRRFYAEKMECPSITPRTSFRLPLGYFDGINPERGIAWRVADALSLRQFLG